MSYDNVDLRKKGHYYLRFIPMEFEVELNGKAS
jgi:hypothetical protein